MREFVPQKIYEHGYTGNKYARPISTKQGDDYIKVVKKANLLRSLVQLNLLNQHQTTTFKELFFDFYICDQCWGKT